MRKNLVAMLLVGAVAATAVIGLSACGGDSIEKGVEVSEDEWKAAFKASSEAESYTMDVTSSEEATGYETVDGNKINLSYKMTGSGKVYAEKAHPELCGLQPRLRSCAHIRSLHHSDYHRQPQRKRDEEPVIDGCKGELPTRPIHYGH